MTNKKTVIIDFGKVSSAYCGLAETALNFAGALNAVQDCDFEFTYIVPKPLQTAFDRQVGANAIVPDYSGLRRGLYYLCRQKSILCALPDFDLYHYLHFYSPWGPNGKFDRRLLLTVHDFHAMQRKRAAKRLHRKLAAVGTVVFISKFAASQYGHHVNFPAITTSVIANGVRVPPEVSRADSRQWQKQFGDYLFTLGGLRRKNLHALLGMMEKTEDFENLRRLKLVIAGNIKADYQRQLSQQVQRANLQNKIIFSGAVSDAVKFQLMAACRAFVFPSLQEGFGLPVIEAMHFGKAVFAAHKTSLPEVAGRHAYYWHQFDPGYMAEVLHQGLLQEQAGQKQINHKSAQRMAYARRFNWQENARQYLQLYKTILADKQ